MDHTDTSLYRSHHFEYESPLRQQRFTILSSILMATSMSFTVFFTYNSSLEHPVSSKLIFENPERSILVLNIASQVTIFYLAELTSSILEASRWAFACTSSGVAAFTFLALSGATSAVGVLCLILGRGANPGTIQRDGYMLWGGQRCVPKLLDVHLETVFLVDTVRLGYPPSVEYFLQLNIPWSLQFSDLEGRA